MSLIRLNGEKEGIIYEIDDSIPPLGQGGMGTVFRGTRIDETAGTQRAAAIKFLYEDLPDSVITRAKLEASIQIHNDNLLEMFGFIQCKIPQADGTVLLRNHVASELLTGVSLFDLLNGRTVDKDGNPIVFAEELYKQYSNVQPSSDNEDSTNKGREDFAVFIIKSVLSGILALHDAGFIHRDIDPSNIMITSDGKVKIIDFGVVKRLKNENNGNSPKLSRFGHIIGKPDYAAPEVANGLVDEHDFTTDIYSIGVLFFQLMTGHLPFDGDESEILSKQRSVALPVGQIRNPEIAGIIRKATEKRRSDRFQSVSEFRVALEQLGHNPISKPKVGKHFELPETWLWVIIIVSGLLVGFLISFIR